ncbi:MAG TPA: methyltransferase domain-containing protein [Acetobacteraceae bacterium]|nr:methyltransferase domain-containing protein [Acetobacteraceae bacterium]
MDANEAQRRYWNEVAGPRWVAGQGFRERRNLESLALLLDHLRLTGGESVLEIGCGTGAVTLPLATAVGERGRVIAVDISDPMLGVARQRIAESGMHNVTLLQGDAQVFAFEPATFDIATSRMGVMFFADPVAAFRNIAGALKPGGRLVFACWAPLAENRHWLISYDIAVRHLGSPAPSTNPEPGPLAFGNPDYIRGILTAAGFADIAVERAHPTITGGSPEEEARQALMMGPTARLIEAKQPPETVRKVIAEEIAAAFAAAASAGPIRLPATIFLVTSHK